jgi:hypothetical protein
MDGAAVGGARLAAVLEEKERAPALALGAVRGRCRSRRHLPCGSAGRAKEDTSTSLGGGAWMVQE